MSSRVRTVFLGSGRFGVETLRQLHEHEDVEVVGVVTAPPRPAGRGARLRSTPVHEAAADLGVGAVLPVTSLRSADAVATVLALEPGLAVLADFGQIVPKTLLDLPHGALNLHPSLLPRHRGAAPIQTTILAGDTETGVTLIRMDAGLDTGPIVAQTRSALSGTETAPELEARLELEAGELLARNLGPWLGGEIEPRPQPDEGATMTRVLRREDGRLDHQRSAEYLERQVRAYQPWPGSFLDTELGRIAVWRAAIAGGLAEGQPPGTLVPLTTPGRGPGLGLATSDGVLELLEVQPAGRQRMSGADLLRGRPALAGTRPGQAPPAHSGQER